MQRDRVFIRNVIACQDLTLRALRQFQDTNTINIKGAFAEESATPDRAPLKRQARPRAAAAPPGPEHPPPPPPPPAGPAGRASPRQLGTARGSSRPAPPPPAGLREEGSSVALAGSLEAGTYLRGAGSSAWQPRRRCPDTGDAVLENAKNSQSVFCFCNFFFTFPCSSQLKDAGSVFACAPPPPRPLSVAGSPRTPRQWSGFPRLWMVGGLQENNLNSILSWRSED